MDVKIQARLKGELGDWFQKLVEKSGKTQTELVIWVFSIFQQQTPDLNKVSDANPLFDLVGNQQQPQPNPPISATKTPAQALELYKQKLLAKAAIEKETELFKEESRLRQAEIKISTERAITEEKKKRLRSISNRREPRIDMGDNEYGGDGFYYGDA